MKINLNSADCLIMAALTCLLLMTGCYRQDVMTMEIEISQMRHAECSRIIINALQNVEGIKYVDPDMELRILTVSYDSRTLALKNIEYIIAEAGFTANDWEAEMSKRMRLPSQCQ